MELYGLLGKLKLDFEVLDCIKLQLLAFSFTEDEEEYHQLRI